MITANATADIEDVISAGGTESLRILRWREMDSNHRSLARNSRFLCGRRIAGTGQGQPKGLFLMRYRWFESISLQRRVLCEPHPSPGSRLAIPRRARQQVLAVVQPRAPKRGHPGCLSRVGPVSARPWSLSMSIIMAVSFGMIGALGFTVVFKLENVGRAPLRMRSESLLPLEREPSQSTNGGQAEQPQRCSS
jgi:hypothetical protein